MSVKEIIDQLNVLSFAELRDLQRAVESSFRGKAAAELAAREAEIDELRELAGMRKRPARKIPKEAVADPVPYTGKRRGPKPKVKEAPAPVSE